MAISIGTQLGSHEITALIGRGGMGEVYRARDTRLKREVAIKILPEQFARDPERVGRFQREAEVLASLNHPNIAAIHSLEEAGGSRYLVLELVEGETLADRIQRGPIPIDEALSIGGHICEALVAAHEKGVVHRDLKPANVKITPDGKVKVLDFGLAKALDRFAPEGSFEPSNSPTLSAMATGMGIVLGTAAYMSPEQARGKAIDKRTDIWAFGCVLYEMLTAKRAFDGEDVTDTIAAVVRGAPGWDALPADVPEQIRMLLKLCLEKDRNKRLPDISIAQFLMTETMPEPPKPSAASASVPASRRRVLTIAGVTFVLGLFLAVIGMWTVARFNAGKPAQPVRLAIVPPAAQPLTMNGGDRDIAVTPDGSHIVYRASGPGGIQLAVRALDQLDAHALPGINDAREPFISPDGRWIGFFANQPNEMKKVPLTGGPPITLCPLTAFPRGASWAPDDRIIFATSDPATGLLSVSAAGGEPKVLTKPDAAKGEQDHLFPFVLPGGNAVLFTITAVGQPIENTQVAVLDLKTGQKKTLIRGGAYAEYVETGHLVYAVAGTLRAVRFDPARLEVLSDPVPVVEEVATFGTGAANFAISKSGALVYVPGTAIAGAQRSLAWLDRQGKEEPLSVPLRAYAQPRISPDGTRIALDIRDQEGDIWVWDLMRRTLTRLTFDPGADEFPVWTPDSRRIIFYSAHGGPPNLYWQAADNTGMVERLTTSPNFQTPTSISSDGKHVAFAEVTPKTGNDIAVLTLGDKPSTDLLVHTPFREFNP